MFKFGLAVFMLGIFMGFSGMRFFDRDLLKGEVLSQEFEEVVSPMIIPTDLIPLFDEFSRTYNVDKEKLARIAYCESHFNRGVWKPPYAGMYQFHEKTWEKYRNIMGKDPNIDLRFGARESIETAAFVLSIGQQHIWPSCSK